MRTVFNSVFPLAELSAAAKEAARNWYRQYAMDENWYDSVYEDAANIADILGIDIRNRKVSFRNGNTRYDGINIMFSGFSSQGDGAQFVGKYSYAKGAAKAIREYAPLDTELHRIADELQAIQCRHFYGIAATVEHSGHYQHEYCTDIDVEMTDDRHGNYRYMKKGDKDDVAILLRDFMRWIYRALEKEYDYQNSAEAVDERIEASGFEFTADGSRSISIH